MSQSSERRWSAARVFALSAVLVLLASCGGSNNTLYVPQTVVIGDFNRDGAIDIAVASTSITQTISLPANSGFVAVGLQNKSSPGTFLASSHYAIAGAASGLAVGDLTGDGIPDLVAASNASSKISVLLHSGVDTGQFQTAVDYSAGELDGLAIGPNAVAVGVLDKSGLPAIAAPSQITYTDPDTGVEVASGVLLIWYPVATSPGTFTSTPISLPLPNRGIRIAIGDINGDGLNDIAVTSFDVDGNNGLVSIFYQNPAQPDPTLPNHFLPRVDLDAGAEPSGVVIDDMLGDGVMDLVMANEGGSSGTGVAGATVIMQAQGEACATRPKQQIPPTNRCFLSPATYATTVSGNLSVATGDLNGDGKKDIVVVSNFPIGQGTISIFIQDPSYDGKFEAVPSPGVSAYAGAGHTNSVAIADVNGDGAPDLVLADGTGMCVMLQTKGAATLTFGAVTQVGG